MADVQARRRAVFRSCSHFPVCRRLRKKNVLICQTKFIPFISVFTQFWDNGTLSGAGIFRSISSAAWDKNMLLSVMEKLSSIIQIKYENSKLGEQIDSTSVSFGDWGDTDGLAPKVK